MGLVSKFINPFKARAYRSTEQSNIPNNTWTKVLVNAISFDPGDNVDIVNSRIIVPLPGYYLIIGVILWKSGTVVADHGYYTGIFKNGALQIQDGAQSSSTLAIMSSLASILYLSENDYIELYAWHNAGVNTVDIYGSSETTYITMHLLSL